MGLLNPSTRHSFRPFLRTMKMFLVSAQLKLQENFKAFKVPQSLETEEEINAFCFQHIFQRSQRKKKPKKNAITLGACQVRHSKLMRLLSSASWSQISSERCQNIPPVSPHTSVQPWGDRTLSGCRPETERHAWPKAGFERTKIKTNYLKSLVSQWQFKVLQQK